MKIGIVTLQPRCNFGGILQAYAMQKILTQLGHRATLIDSFRGTRLPAKTRHLVYAKRAFEKIILRKNQIIFTDKYYTRKILTIAKNTLRFIDNNIIRIEKEKDFSDIREKEFDAYIVGSDQVWRPMYFHSQIENAYLDFAKGWNVKRIAYAASFGTEEWEYNEQQTSKCASLLKMFDAVSVREASAVKLCKMKFGVEAKHLLDPTMLLDRQDYIELFEKAGTKESKGKIFCYILDSNEKKSNLITNLAKEKSLEPFYVNSKYENEGAPIEERIQQPVEKWLRAFYDAEFVITDSFHACVFSIIFNKPFYVIGNKSRGMSRFESLLGMFGLEDRLIPSTGELTHNVINWEKVNTILQDKRKESIDFLRKHLGE